MLHNFIQIAFLYLTSLLEAYLVKKYSMKARWEKLAFKVAKF